MNFDIYAVLAGIGAGITVSVGSYWKQKELEEFSWLKFGTTVILGGFAGVMFAVTGMPLDTGMEYGLSLGLVPLAENVLKIIWRKLFKSRFLGD